MGQGPSNGKETMEATVAFAHILNDCIKQAAQTLLLLILIGQKISTVLHVVVSHLETLPSKQ